MKQRFSLFPDQTHLYTIEKDQINIFTQKLSPVEEGKERVSYPPTILVKYTVRSQASKGLHSIIIHRDRIPDIKEGETLKSCDG